jgi:hypothetical protein
VISIRFDDAIDPLAWVESPRNLYCIVLYSAIPEEIMPIRR